MRIPRCIAVLTALACLTACGDSKVPVGPTPATTTVATTTVSTTTTTAPPAQTVPLIDGAWRGTAEFQFSGSKRFTNMTMTLSQNAGSRSVRGTWQFDAPWLWTGSLDGSLSGEGTSTTFSGLTTVVAEVTGNTGKCHGNMTMSGTVVNGVLRWTADHITWTDCVGNVGGIVWILGR